MDPKLAIAYYGRALAYGNKCDLDKAILDFSEATRLDPKYAAAYHDRGLAYEKKGDKCRRKKISRKRRSLATLTNNRRGTWVSKRRHGYFVVLPSDGEKVPSIVFR